MNHCATGEITVKMDTRINCDDNEMEFEENYEQVYPLNTYESISNREQILYKQLLKALQSKNFHSFKNLINHDLAKSSSIVKINYEYPNTKETFLDIASKNGLTEFVKFLLDKGAYPNRVNIFHDRAPIHFATEGKHKSTLKILLEETDPNLETKEFQTALHFAVINNDRDCANLLLKNGASASIPNSMGLSALHLAAMEKQRDIVEAILKKSKKRPNVDTYKDCTGKTTRQVIQENLPGIPLSEYKSDVDVQVLKYYLIVYDETNFLKNIELVKFWELYDAARMLLETAAQHGFHEAVISILKIIEGEQYSIMKSAQDAIGLGDHVLLQALLEEEPEIANDLILDACKALEISERQKADQLTCLKLILKQKNVNVRCSDSDGNIPLHYVSKAGNEEAVILLLKAGSYIGHMNSSNEPPIAYIPEKILRDYFDECLQTRRDSTECNKYSIEFNYRCLMPHDVLMEDNETCRETDEMEVFKYIANDDDLKHLLKHPLLSSFLYLKWHRIRYALYANLAFYVIFYCVLNAYIISPTYYTQIGNKQTDNGRPLESKLQTVWNQNNFLHAVTAVMLLLFILREVNQFVLCIRRYLTNLRNWLQIALIIFTFALLCGAGLQIGVIVILLSAWELMILVSQHPYLSIGIEMFQMVSFDFMRFLFPYFFLILAFALAFYTLFKDDMRFSDPGLSLFKTVIMLTGEFDASMIPFNLHPHWSYIVFILFVFFIAIVLLNLLNGLAVSDTTTILSKTELVRLISRTRLLANIEDTIIIKPFGRHYSYYYSRLLSRNLFNFLTKRILLFPHILRNGKININTGDNNRCYTESVTMITDYKPKYRRKGIFKPRKVVIKNIGLEEFEESCMPSPGFVTRDHKRYADVYEDVNEDFKIKKVSRHSMPASEFISRNCRGYENEDVNEDINDDVKENFKIKRVRQHSMPALGFISQDYRGYVDEKLEHLSMKRYTKSEFVIHEQRRYVDENEEINEHVNRNVNEIINLDAFAIPVSLSARTIEPLRMDPYIFKEAKRIICKKKWMMKRS